MPPAASAYSAYRTAEVETLTQRDLIIKLYQGAERFLLQAKIGMENKQIESATEGCQKAKRIFVEFCRPSTSTLAARSRINCVTCIYLSSATSLKPISKKTRK